MDARTTDLLSSALQGAGPIVFLTGAGVSAESGIPTFRGPEGYWQVGSVNYRAEDLATCDAFTRMPEEVWAWYLYRRGVCRAARPNAAHMALVEAERALGRRFLLVTQNVDGLHLRAGSSVERTYQIHGNIDFMRVEREHPRIRPIPESVALDWPKARALGAAEREALLEREGWARPHVLFFDESYDEELFRFESTLRAMSEAAALVVIGTSGATNLPSHAVEVAARRNIPLVVVNQDESRFTEAAERAAQGHVLRGTATQHVPAMVDFLVAA